MTNNGNMSLHIIHDKIMNLINGKLVESSSHDYHPIFDPGKGEEIGMVPFSSKDDVDKAVESASDAFESWSKLPMPDRLQYLFKLKVAMEEKKKELATAITINHGKTLTEAIGELDRAIQNIESAISLGYTLFKGQYMRSVAVKIDEISVREPIGVVGIIAPFNFPIMVPFWFIPYALVYGDTVVVKPSEITPLGMMLVGEILQKIFPPGVVNIVNGAKESVDRILEHGDIKAVTFVGSTNTAKYIYAKAAEHGKRVSASGGAKNFAVVMPDAKLDDTVSNLISSFFGSAGQRCLANANLVAVGDVYNELKRKFVAASKSMRVGYGLDEGTDVGPVVNENALRRIRGYIEKGVEEGAKLILDGRDVKVERYPKGYYIGPTIFDEVSPDMVIAKDEIFGPVASILHVRNLDEAIDLVNRSRYGNASSIFTSAGGVAREFASRVVAGNVGINIGVAQPMAFFPFAGMKESFFGALHPQVETLDLFTDRKVIIERWF
ncbi:CoA-acylating methylmalonate-semialdehyde dehydrogenase [Metallosphaera javensis (ex Sakai et al. 2022)]|uniref:CoA-acylating methylmalonate-semialdehyde dehydrogenase n=1 Tax=Metallosphaera javensis (ex Sakai et al. 2022) TaxID=2775498 RepID=UPI0025907A70|nr:MAG: methylmalonate-semialdehyde dehydrogenase (CoA acylating) [Metallosphaera javensis (ex Sakai et al. 2022)]